MIRDVTGLNEARDASTPDKNSLVGIQKIAAANSNTATRHILQSMLLLASETAEAISLRISDIVEYSPTKDAFIQAIGAHNVATLEEMKELHLYDFGIFIELMPDDEEKQILENNIQQALSQGLIDLDDAIDLRDVRNVKLANQLLKIKRQKKAERDQMMQQQNIEAQAQANAQAQEAAAQAEIQKNQARADIDMRLEQQKNDLKIQYLEREAMLKKELMNHEMFINERLKKAENEVLDNRMSKQEDRKDNREARKRGETVKTFESSGNDVIGGGLGLERFDPR